MSTAPVEKKRLGSLDQFRGYTVVGMVFVNFVGAYAVIPPLLKHHNTYCSYADTIMPQFFFAVGFAFRLTFGRREHAAGLASAYAHVVRRFLGLALVAMVLEHLGPRAAHWDQFVGLSLWDMLREPLTHSWFGSPLMHIALTSLWITPVIRASGWVRVAYMLASAIAQLLLSHWFYFEWVYSHGVDGGPYGFLSWTIPTIVGTLACDVVTSDRPRPVTRLFVGAAGLMLAGYLLSCLTTLYDVPAAADPANTGREIAIDPVLPSSERLQTAALAWAELPFAAAPGHDVRQRNYWMMSQRAATPSYHAFAAGIALAVYALFYVVCDRWGWQLGLFRTFGSNALVAFIIHDMVGDSVEAFVPRDAPLWYVTAAFLAYFGITYLFVRHLEKNNIYLKL